MPRKNSKTSTTRGKVRTNGVSKPNGSASDSAQLNGTGKTEKPVADSRIDTNIEEIEERETAAIDDPVRMYLMQMGEIPMLSRENEVSSAKRIESTRFKFRQTMLANDFVLHGAAELLQKVSEGNLRLDRTIEISVTNTAEKKRVLKRIVPNLATIRQLLAQNQIDFRVAVSRRASPEAKKAAWRRLVCRRNKAVRLVEELNLRLQRLLPVMEQLHEISARMTSVKQQLSQPEKLLHAAQPIELTEELRYLMRITLETPATLGRLTARTLKRKRAYDVAKSNLSAANLRLVVSIAKSTAIAD